MSGQLSWLEEHTDEPKAAWKLGVDGASRGNPGVAGAGFFVAKNTTIVLRQGYFLGTCTNNQAEYAALLLGICQARKLLQSGDSLHIIADSELLVRQMRGVYRVRHDILQSLHGAAHRMLAGIPYTIEHVLRAENKIADALANEGIDKKIPVPEGLWDSCGLAELWKQICNL